MLFSESKLTVNKRHKDNGTLKRSNNTHTKTLNFEFLKQKHELNNLRILLSNEL